jgi:hypothetical protein
MTCMDEVIFDDVSSGMYRILKPAICAYLLVIYNLKAY